MMISDQKKEEVKAAADIVEVIGDYVKLKKSGSGFTGLCPYHNEKTPSFHVSPRLGIYKCFGCGESGDVFKFVMDQDGIGFTEAVRQLADRYGVFIPEEEQSDDPILHEEEGILHTLKYAGLFYYRNLIENPEAEPALEYLSKRGYDREIIKHFGLGYAPASGTALYDSAKDAGISEDYLVRAGLIKPSQRSEGFYDVFRGRLMFPIFNPSKKVIAFAGRILSKEKTAKYINTAQTEVYNKSEVVYGLNFSRNDIRKNAEVILVEGYTDVITLHQHDIKNVVASSGTALTEGQLRLIKRYGSTITMIYDADSAGQEAMKRGIDIALAEGFDVELLSLPEGDDPDSFVKQFGKDSFLDFKKEESTDFITYLIRKAELQGDMEHPTKRAGVITEVLRSIAKIPDTIKRQVFVQHLHQKTHKYRSGTDRELFVELDRMLTNQEATRKKDAERQRMRQQRDEERQLTQEEPPIFDPNSPPVKQVKKQLKKPHYEKELIRLMISYGRDMVEYIGGLSNENLLEDDELKSFFKTIIEDYRNEESITINRYTSMSEPFPSIVADVLVEQHSPSDRHHEKTGLKYTKDKNKYETAKSTIKSLQLSYSKRVRAKIAEQLINAETDLKHELIKQQAHIQREINRLESMHFSDLYPDPEIEDAEETGKKFEYKMKSDKSDQ